MKRGQKTRGTRQSVRMQREQILETIARRVIMGFTHAKIAEELGVTRSQVTKDVTLLKKRLRESQTVNIAEMKRRHIAKLETVEYEAWDGWVRSKAKDFDNPQFLNTALKSLGDQADIEGLAPPKQVNLNDISKRPIDELLERLVGRLPSIAHALANRAGASGD